MAAHGLVASTRMFVQLLRVVSLHQPPCGAARRVGAQSPGTTNSAAAYTQHPEAVGEGAGFDHFYYPKITEIQSVQIGTKSLPENNK